MKSSRLYIAVAGLIAGFLLSNVTQRQHVDLNMDGAPPVSVPGYTGPIYDAKGLLVGYAQPKIVNLTPPIVPATVAVVPNGPAHTKMAAARPVAEPHSGVKPMTLR